MESARWWEKYAWVLVFVISVLLALAGLFILSSPIDAGDFERETGMAWNDFQQTDPEVADYLTREARLLASVTLGFGVFAAGVTWIWFRRRVRSAWLLMWTLPAVLGLTAVVFFAAQAAALGSFYAVAAVAAGIGVLLPMRVMTG